MRSGSANPGKPAGKARTGPRWTATQLHELRVFDAVWAYRQPFLRRGSAHVAEAVAEIRFPSLNEAGRRICGEECAGLTVEERRSWAAAGVINLARRSGLLEAWVESELHLCRVADDEDLWAHSKTCASNNYGIAFEERDLDFALAIASTMFCQCTMNMMHAVRRALCAIPPHQRWALPPA